MNASGATREIVIGGALTIGALAFFGVAMFVTGRSGLSWSASPLAAASIIMPLVFESYDLIPRATREAVTQDGGVLSGLARDSRRDAPRPRVWRETGFSIAANASPEPDVLAGAMAKTAIEDLGWLHGFAYLRGYSPVLSGRRISAVFQRASKHNQLLRIMQLFNTEYAVAGEITPPRGFEVVVRDTADLSAVLHATSTRPRAFVAGRWTRLASDEAVVNAMFEPAADLGLVRFVSGGASGPSDAAAGPGVGGPCEVHTSHPEQVDLQCWSPQGGYAVLVDSWSPGWSATVDGTPADIERADMLLRAVRLGPGYHHVSFAYHTPGLRTGALVSVVAWLVGGFLVWTSRARVVPAIAETDRPTNEIPATARTPEVAKRTSKGRQASLGKKGKRQEER